MTHGSIGRWALVALAGLASGCGDSQERPARQRLRPQRKKPVDRDEDLKKRFPGLSREDAGRAEAQETCPVGGEELGSMGTPVKMAVKGRTVFLCCDWCQKQMLANPDRYLAKLNRK